MTECLSGMVAEVARSADQSPRPRGAARRPFLPGTGARGRAVRIAVTALADHAGPRVIPVGPAAERDLSAGDAPGRPAGLCAKRRARSQKES